VESAPVIAGFYRVSGTVTRPFAQERFGTGGIRYTYRFPEAEFAGSKVVSAVRDLHYPDIIVLLERSNSLMLASVDFPNNRARWTRLVSFPDETMDFFAPHLIADANGQIIVSVGTTSDGQEHRLHTLKIDGATGNDLWSVTIDGGTQAFQPMDVALDDNLNVYVSGRFEGYPGVIKFDADGAEPQIPWWFPFTGGASSTEGGFVSVSVEGSFVYATGTFKPTVTEDAQMLTACLDPSGFNRWYDAFDPHALDSTYEYVEARAVAAGQRLGTTYVYVIGDAYDTGAGDSKGVAMVGRYPAGGSVVTAPESSIPPRAQSWRVGGGATLRVWLGEATSTPTAVEIFDVAGRRVTERIIPAGRPELRVFDLASGAYFIRIPALGRVARQAVVVR
jgi:hypothetical protein